MDRSYKLKFIKYLIDMLPGTYKSSLYTVSGGSLSNKKEVLWNVQQPGDSYDIKRSMIAKIPGEKSFMGEHVQLVCLFQAAQIERLTDFLQSYKNRLKDIERTNIDHHSYQVQIKQLFQRIAQFDSIKGQNSKMIEFVKKQSIEIETLHQVVRSNNEIDQNFKNALELNKQKITALTDENFELRNAVNSNNVRFGALERAKNQEIEEIKRATVMSKEQSQNSKTLFKMQLQSELKKLQFELKNFRQQNNLKDQQIIKLRRQKQALQSQSPKSHGKSQKQVYLQQSLAEYQTKISIFSQQIQRLNIVIRQSTNKSETFKRNEDEYQQRVKQYEVQLRESDQKLKTYLAEMVNMKAIINQFENENKHKQQLQRHVAQYNSKIAELKVQNEDLKSKILQAVNSSRMSQDEIQRLNFQNSRIRILNKENSELREHLAETSELKRQLAVTENQRIVLVQQNERLVQIIQSRQVELENIRPIINETELLKNKLRELQINLTHSYEIELANRHNEYEYRLKQITETKGNEAQLRLSKLQIELQQYKSLLKNRTEESQKQRTVIFQLDSKYSRLQGETAIKIKTYELNLANFKKENQELYFKTRQLNDLQRKVIEFQNRSTYLEGDNQRLSLNLRNKEQQNLNLKKRVQELESNIQKYELDASRKIGNYQQYVNKYKIENEQLQRRILQLASEQSKRDATYAAEIKKKIELETINRQLLQQLEVLKQNLDRLNVQNEQYRKRVVDTQTKHISFYNQNTLNIKNSQLQNQNLRRQAVDLKNSILSYENQISKRSVTYDQNLNFLSKDNEELRKKQRQVEAAVKKLSYQMESLNKLHLQKVQELAASERNLKNAVAENQNMKRYIKEYEVNVNNRFQGEVQRKYLTYETTIQNISRQLQDYRNRYIDLQNKFIKLSQEQEKLALNIKNLQLQNETLRKQISQKDNLVVNYQSEVNRKIANYEANLGNLTRSSHDAQAKLSEQEQNMRKNYEEFLRLEAAYKNVTQQHENLKKRYKDLEISMGQKLQGEVAQRYQYYEQNIMKITQDNEELRKKFNQLNNELNRRVNQISKLNLIVPQNQSLKKRIQKYQVSINAYELEVNRRFASYEQSIQTLIKENQELKRKIQQNNEINRHISLENDERQVYFTRQLEKITISLKNIEKQNGQLKKRLIETGDLGRVIVDLQNKLTFNSQELQRVNASLRAKCDEFNKSELKIRNIMLDLESAKRSNVELESRFKSVIEVQVSGKYNIYEQTINDLKRKLSESQLRSQNLSLQLQRLGGSFKIKSQQSSQIYINYKNLTNEYEQLKGRMKQIQLTSSQNLVNSRRENDQLKRKIQETEYNFKQFGQDSQKRFLENENKNKIMVQEIQRLNQVVKVKNEEIERGRKQLKQYQLTFSQFSENEVRYKVNIENSNREVQQLKKRLYEFNDVHKRAVEIEGNLKVTGQQYEKLVNILKARNEEYVKMEQRVLLISQQNEKFQQNLRVKNEQVINLDSKQRQYMNEIQNYKKHIIQMQKTLVNKYQVEINRKTMSFQQNISNINKERQDLYKKKLDYQSKIGLLTTEIQRLNIVIRTKNEDLQRSLNQAQNMRQLSQRKLLTSESQLTTLVSKYKNLSNQNQLARKHLVEYESNINRLHTQFERLQAIIEQLKKERQSLYQKNLILGDEIERLTEENKDLQNQTKDVRLKLSDESSLQKRINEHLGLMVILFAQIESLRKRVVDKQKQVQNVRRASLSPHIMRH